MLMKVSHNNHVFASLPPTAKGMRIGLYGGSFNPAHCGHVAVAREALRRLHLHQLWWLISPQNPLKVEKPAAMDERLAALRALARHPQFHFLTFEQEQRLNYSYQTVRAVLKRNQGVRFVWIMGADSFAGLDHWRRWRWIVGRIALAVFDRPGYRYQALHSRAGHFLQNRKFNEAHASRLLDVWPPAWSYLSFPLSPLSSSQLRAAARGTSAAKAPVAQ